MKKRINFVSNSSSSSCVIHNWSEISDEKKDMVLNPYPYVVGIWKRANCKFVCNDEFKTGHLEQQDNILDFGFLGDWWRNQYNEQKDEMEFTTSMDNFDLFNWLDYIDVAYEDTGENLGFFSNEEIAFNTEFLEKLCEAKNKGM